MIWYDMPFPPAHYYSPLPDIRSLKQNLVRWYKEDTSPGVDWNVQGQLELLEQLKPYYAEVAALPTFSQVTQDGYGPGYGEIEALLLYMMLRHVKPSRVIEIGSGVSTFYTLTAPDANRERDNVTADVRGTLPEGQTAHVNVERNVRLHESVVQAPGSSYFSNWMLMMFYLSIPAT